MRRALTVIVHLPHATQRPAAYRLGSRFMFQRLGESRVKPVRLTYLFCSLEHVCLRQRVPQGRLSFLWERARLAQREQVVTHASLPGSRISLPADETAINSSGDRVQLRAGLTSRRLQNVAWRGCAAIISPLQILVCVLLRRDTTEMNEREKDLPVEIGPVIGPDRDPGAGVEV